MRQPGEWMQLPTDERILEILNSGLLLSPQVIAKNIDKSRVHVNRRLSVLVDYGLVTRVERGYYEIAGPGVQYLEGELDADDLEPDSE
ncbi:ArsR family transcriptional regulator [Natrinema thermotolerans]|uniref:ArsR family transcriptional regulator n=1 Tax=Natrinema thermotolerans TaxID=121872 RepID=A0AAF0P6N0_9EURY|nr:helix-turn-helix transcriptional regulator [Natrinema thermotolerans]WMT06233.1 ArsR family transcriptional regulator [Natrinema thermotolerans]